MYKILVLNPGSTSTKFAVFHDGENVFQQTLRHSGEELAPFSNVASQYEFRKETILDCLKTNNVSVDFNIVVGRGGLLKPVESGVYEVNDAMRNDLMSATYGEHASNLGGLIAADIAASIPGCRAVIADPVVVDELQPEARISGHPLMPRISIFHALNQKAIARMHAQKEGKSYQDMNLVVAHLGGGVSVGAHQKGRVIDVNNALNGTGPFSPERVGTVQSFALIDICFSGKYSQQEIKKMIVGNGGLMAHLGTNDAYEVEKRSLSGTDPHAKLVYDAMAYNVAKEIGAAVAVLKGNVDGILITGGIAYDKGFCAYIEDMVKSMAPVYVYPGEDELGALAMNGLRVLEGESTSVYC